jgi:hypothetical protein
VRTILRLFKDKWRKLNHDKEENRDGSLMYWKLLSNDGKERKNHTSHWNLFSGIRIHLFLFGSEKFFTIIYWYYYW